MLKATLRCKRFLQAILSKEATLSIKRMQACAELEILQQDLEALPDDERTAVRRWRFMNNRGRNHKKPVPETPWHKCAGVLAWLPLSPSCDGAS